MASGASSLGPTAERAARVHLAPPVRVGAIRIGGSDFPLYRRTRPVIRIYDVDTNQSTANATVAMAIA